MDNVAIAERKVNDALADAARVLTPSEYLELLDQLRSNVEARIDAVRREHGHD
jgi:hypothetical protein